MSIAKCLLGTQLKTPLAMLPGVILLGALLSLGGCASKPIYFSTPEMPATLWVNDVNSGQVLWSMNVPVQYKLQVNFTRQGQNDFYHIGQEPPTSLKWVLYDLDDNKKVEDTVALPGTAVIMRVTYRSAPELPGVTPIPTPGSTATANPSAAPTTQPAG